MLKIITKATNTFFELLVIYATMIFFSSLLYSLVEAKSFGDSVWWAIVTATTTGYGDQYPVTLIGRTIAGFLMHGMILFILPLMILRLVTTVVEDIHRFSDDEQKRMFAFLQTHTAMLERLQPRPWAVVNEQGQYLTWDSLGPIWQEGPQHATRFFDQRSADNFIEGWTTVETTTPVSIQIGA